MNAVQDFERAIQNAMAQGIKNGLGALTMAGLLTFKVADLRDIARQQHAEAQRSKIVRGAIIPNGEG